MDTLEVVSSMTRNENTKVDFTQDHANFFKKIRYKTILVFQIFFYSGLGTGSCVAMGKIIFLIYAIVFVT